MRVCYFGSYNPDYNRNRIIINGLRKNGVEVIECNDRSGFLIGSLRLIKQALFLNFDAIMVGYPGHFSIFPAKLVSLIKRKPLIFDAFISTYNTNVELLGSVDTSSILEGEYVERARIKEGSLKARFYFLLDTYSCKLANMVLLDTIQHINYFHLKFGIKRDKFKCIPIGADETLFYPGDIKKGDTFLVLFYGRPNVLHGIEHILNAAKILERHRDIKIMVIRELVDRLTAAGRENIEFKEAVSYEEIPRHIAAADICLGIFGDTNKTKMVVPNKAYEAIAMGKPLITGDTPAAREIFTDRKNALLCEVANPNAIAESILLLKNDPKLREEIAKNGYDLFQKNFTSEIIGESVLIVLNEVLNRKVGAG